MIRSLCLTLIFALASCAAERFLTGSAEDVRVPTVGGFLLLGGGGNVDPGFRWFAEKANGGDIVVLRSSGADQMNRYLPGIKPVDSVETWVLRTPEDSRDDAVLQSLAGAEGIFIAGGDQWNYIRLWKDSPVAEAINAAARRGVPIGGSSAGLAVLGQHAFSAQFDTVKSADALRDPFDKRITVESEFLQFSTLKGVLTDSHFRERDRMGRLLVFLARAGVGARGLGIDESTAVLVEPDGAARVVGRGSAYFIRSTRKPELQAGIPLSGAHYEIERVSAGGTFQVRQWSGSGKRYELRVDNGAVNSATSDIY